jgi:hypothetical protein
MKIMNYGNKQIAKQYGANYKTDWERMNAHSLFPQAVDRPFC